MRTSSGQGGALIAVADGLVVADGNGLPESGGECPSRGGQGGGGSSLVGRGHGPSGSQWATSHLPGSRTFARSCPGWADPLLSGHSPSPTAQSGWPVKAGVQPWTRRYSTSPEPVPTTCGTTFAAHPHANVACRRRRCSLGPTTPYSARNINGREARQVTVCRPTDSLLRRKLVSASSIKTAPQAPPCIKNTSLTECHLTRSGRTAALSPSAQVFSPVHRHRHCCPEGLGHTGPVRRHVATVART